MLTLAPMVATLYNSPNPEQRSLTMYSTYLALFSDGSRDEIAAESFSEAAALAEQYACDKPDDDDCYVLSLTRL